MDPFPVSFPVWPFSGPARRRGHVRPLLAANAGDHDPAAVGRPVARPADRPTLREPAPRAVRQLRLRPPRHAGAMPGVRDGGDDGADGMRGRYVSQGGDSGNGLCGAFILLQMTGSACSAILAKLPRRGRYYAITAIL
jgi:hypothetical protein